MGFDAVNKRLGGKPEKGQSYEPAPVPIMADIVDPHQRKELEKQIIAEYNQATDPAAAKRWILDRIDDPETRDMVAKGIRFGDGSVSPEQLVQVYAPFVFEMRLDFMFRNMNSKEYGPRQIAHDIAKGVESRYYESIGKSKDPDSEVSNVGQEKGLEFFDKMLKLAEVAGASGKSVDELVSMAINADAQDAEMEHG